MNLILAIIKALIASIYYEISRRDVTDKNITFYVILLCVFRQKFAHVFEKYVAFIVSIFMFF